MKSIVSKSAHNTKVGEGSASQSANNQPDVNAAALLWEALQPNINTLTSRELVNLLYKHNFVLDKSSGSSHFNLQAPSALSALGSFTITPTLNKYVLKKMVVKNFENFFAQYGYADSVSKQSSIQVQVKADVSAKLPKQETKQTPSEESGIHDAGPSTLRTAEKTLEEKKNAATVILHWYQQSVYKREGQLFHEVMRLFKSFEEEVDGNFDKNEFLKKITLYFPEILYFSIGKQSFIRISVDQV